MLDFAVRIVAFLIFLFLMGSMINGRFFGLSFLSQWWSDLLSSDAPEEGGEEV